MGGHEVLRTYESSLVVSFYVMDVKQSSTRLVKLSIEYHDENLGYGSFSVDSASEYSWFAIEILLTEICKFEDPVQISST